ncbi:DUF973 family protein [Acidianus manzaensis]|uniref:DUF973 domain-containing protein n=1 Tax=Acidianus manzaensis TaxID=282676 RepID=A0A1W6JX16_9CREN|nr:DUF973 family protein [Acidianus manzaensis]ARM74754.1 hypothetical protein B6F84_01085 [Acidianus manzaensis]
MKALLRAKKSKKGISGAVTALILVIASVIIALVVVGFAFGLFGAFAGKSTVTQVGTGTIIPCSSGGTLTFTLSSSGSATITSVQLAGTTYSGSLSSSTLTAGTNSITVTFSSGTFVPGNTYDFEVTLADGTVVTVTAQAVSS